MKAAASLAHLFHHLRMSLAARLTIWFAVMAFALLLVATLLMYWRVASHLSAEDESAVSMKLLLVEALLSDALPAPNAVETAANSSDPTSDRLMFVRVLRPDGTVLAQSAGMDNEIPATIVPISRKPAIIQGTSGRTYWVASSLANGDTIHVAAEADDELRLMAPYRERLWLLFGVAFVAAGVIGHRIARHGIKPVVALVETMQGIETSTLDKRIDVSKLPIELAALGKTFNDMLERLEDSFDRVTRFSDDIAHELRTPLGIIRGQIEVALGARRSPAAYRDILESSLEEIVSLSDLVHRMLFLARAENQAIALMPEQIDIGGALSTIFDLYEPAASEAGVSLDVVVASQPLTALGDRLLTLRAIGNLVSNAIRHTPHGGTVTIEASPDMEGVRISVTDSGSGIAEEHLPFIFDRFYRGDRSRSGEQSGLGLAIVKAIVALHGGDVRITSTVGRGTQVTMALPNRS